MKTPEYAREATIALEAIDAVLPDYEATLAKMKRWVTDQAMADEGQAWDEEHTIVEQNGV